MVEPSPPRPDNSVIGAMGSWFPGKYHVAHVQRAKAGGDANTVLVAERVATASTDDSTATDAAAAATAGTADGDGTATAGPPRMILGRALGEGGYGSVRVVSMPDLGFTGAIKIMKAVSQVIFSFVLFLPLEVYCRFSIQTTCSKC